MHEPPPSLPERGPCRVPASQFAPSQDLTLLEQGCSEVTAGGHLEASCVPPHLTCTALPLLPPPVPAARPTPSHQTRPSLEIPRLEVRGPGRPHECQLLGAGGPRGKRDLVLEGCLRLGAQDSTPPAQDRVRGQGCRPVVSSTACGGRAWGGAPHAYKHPEGSDRVQAGRRPVCVLGPWLGLCSQGPREPRGHCLSPRRFWASWAHSSSLSADQASSTGRSHPQFGLEPRTRSGGGVLWPRAQERSLSQERSPPPRPHQQRSLCSAPPGHMEETRQGRGVGVRERG